MTIEERCQKIRLILVDCDGVLTDGSILVDDAGVETKRFHVRDGSAIKLWQQAGGSVGILSGRKTEAVAIRARELGIEIVLQGHSNKLSACQQLLGELDLDPSALCYVGDDLPDLPVVKLAGLGVAVADACPELCRAADLVTRRSGGDQAVREVIETVLKAQGRWDAAVQRFINP